MKFGFPVSSSSLVTCFTTNLGKIPVFGILVPGIPGSEFWVFQDSSSRYSYKSLAIDNSGCSGCFNGLGTLCWSGSGFGCSSRYLSIHEKERSTVLSLLSLVHMLSVFRRLHVVY